MKFSVGYPFREDDRFIEVVSRYKESLSELYFSFSDFSNGRSQLAANSALSRWDVFEKQKEDLERLSRLGLSFALLLNGNCYGADAQSRDFFYKIGETLDYLGARYPLGCVTTTSPLIAKFIKQNFEAIEVRASVNMEIGTAQGMDYLAEWFDSFYLKREYNRSLKRITDARNWCDRNGKKLYGLANSGCLNECSAHHFHDNLVAHEAEIAKRNNAYQFEGQCWEYLKAEGKRKRWLSITNFIRPEDVPLYENLFDGMKLATRVSRHFAKIIEAYAQTSYNGNLPELLEPDHSGLFYPQVIDNASVDPQFAQTVLHCNKNCGDCNYCTQVQQKATMQLKEF